MAIKLSYIKAQQIFDMWLLSLKPFASVKSKIHKDICQICFSENKNFQFLTKNIPFWQTDQVLYVQQMSNGQL